MSVAYTIPATAVYAATQLSDGTPIIVSDNSGNLTLGHSSDRASYASIGTLTNAAASTYTVVGVTVDGSDNIYVVTMLFASPYTYAVQAWKKGSGYAWAAQPVSTISGAAGASPNPNNIFTPPGFEFLWCNTGGTNNAGYLAWNNISSESYSVDAGAILAGTASVAATSFSTGNPFANNLRGWNAQPAFGDPRVVAFSPDGAYTQQMIASPMHVNSTGAMSGTAAASGYVPSGDYLNSPPCAVSLGNQLYLCVMPYGGTYTVAAEAAAYNDSTGTWGALSSGGPVWNTTDPTELVMAADPVTSGQAWAYYFSGSAVTRYPLTVSGSTVTWGAAVTDNSSFSAKSWPVLASGRGSHIDYFSVDGGGTVVNASFTQFASAPNAPTLDSPANAAYFDAAANGAALVGTFNSTDGQVQNAVAIRIKIPGASAYSYLNLSTGALQSTIVWNAISTAPGAQFTVNVPAGLLTDGNAYNWSLASQEAGANLQGPFATDFTFNAQANPTLTVTGPSGTVAAAATTVTWTPSPASGASQTAYRVVVYTAAQYAASGFTPGSGPSFYDSGVVNSSPARSQQVTGLSNYASYKAFVQITESGGQTSAWTSTLFTVAFDFPAQPDVQVSPQSDPSGVPLLRVTVDGHDNLPSADDASFEGGVGTAVAGAGTAVAQTAEASLDGAHSLALTATAAGTISASETAYPVVGGGSYAVHAAFRPVSAARQVTAAVVWSDGTSSSVATVENPLGFTVATGLVTAPAGATSGALRFSVASATAPLGAPAAPTVTTAGTAGTTSYTYAITWVNAYGETVASASTTITTGNATLSGTNYNVITPPAAPAGATGARVYGRSGTLGVLATVSPSGAYNDTGAAAPGAVSPGADSTGERHDVDRAGLFPGSKLGYQLEVLSDGPVAYFPLTDAAGSGSAVNAVGSGNGTVNGGVTFGQAGPILSDASQTAAAFDGSTGYISGAIPPTSGSWTVEAWANITVDQSGPEVFSTRDADSYSFDMQLTTGKIHCDVGNGSAWMNTSADFTLPSALALDSWHHIAFVCTPTTYSIYLDGVVGVSAAALGGSGTPLLSSGGVGALIGALSAGSENFNGRLAHVAAYPAALSGTRIAAHVAAAKQTGPGIVEQWTRGGLAGITQAEVTFTDADNPTPVPLRGGPFTLSSPSQQVTVADYEATPGVARSYQATVSAVV